MSSKGSGKVRDVKVPRFTGFIIDEITPVRNSKYYTLTMRETDSRRVYYKDVVFNEDDIDGGASGARDDFFGYLFGMGEGEARNTSKESRAAIREGRVINGMTKEEVELAMGEAFKKSFDAEGNEMTVADARAKFAMGQAAVAGALGININELVSGHLAGNYDAEDLMGLEEVQMAAAESAKSMGNKDEIKKNIKDKKYKSGVEVTEGQYALSNLGQAFIAHLEKSANNLGWDAWYEKNADKRASMRAKRDSMLAYAERLKASGEAEKEKQRKHAVHLNEMYKWAKAFVENDQMYLKRHSRPDEFDGTSEEGIARWLVANES